MESEKRKRGCEGEEADGKKAKARDGDNDDDMKGVAPADEEVEEFFAILRRIQVALEYFRKRNGGELTAAIWSPSIEREDFVGVEKTPEKQQGNQNAGLDLNSDPGSDDRDVTDSV